MMELPKEERNRLIRNIHVAKRQLGFDEDQYRAFLEETTGKRSCSEMEAGDLLNVINAMRRCGARTAARFSPRSRDKSRKTPADKAVALWIELANMGVVRDRSHDALCQFVLNKIGKRMRVMPGVDPMQAATLQQMRVVITALEAMRDGGQDNPA